MDHWTIPWAEMRRAIRRYKRSLRQGGFQTDDYLAAIESAGKVMIAWANSPFPLVNIDRMFLGLQNRLQSMMNYEDPNSIMAHAMQRNA